MKDKRLVIVLISCLFLGAMLGVYGTRLFYFYHNENKKGKNEADNTIILHIKKETKLLKNKDEYYFKNNKNNYLYFSGLMYRILYLTDDSLVLISDENITNLKYGLNNKYEESDIKKWLEEIYLNNINTSYLKNKSAKLIDKKLYSKTKYKTDSDFWTSDGLIISSNGILQTDKYDLFLGIRPVIELNNFKYISGDGTKNNPYIVENRSINTLDDLYVGEYIKYNNNLLRVIEKNDKGIKVLAPKLNEQYMFSNSLNEYNTKYNNIGYYLNNTYYAKLNKNDIISTDFYIGEYNTSYKDTYSNKINTYVGLLKIGDYFIDSIPNSFILTKKDYSIYSITKDKLLHQEKVTTKLDIYPVFTLNKSLSIKSGNGYKNSPYIVGE